MLDANIEVILGDNAAGVADVHLEVDEVACFGVCEFEGLDV